MTTSIIKFRGTAKNGDTVTGDLTHTITGLPKIWLNGSAIAVDPDSVEIFAGYALNGEKIFININNIRIIPKE